MFDIEMLPQLSLSDYIYYPRIKIHTDRHENLEMFWGFFCSLFLEKTSQKPLLPMLNYCVVKRLKSMVQKTRQKMYKLEMCLSLQLIISG